MLTTPADAYLDKRAKLIRSLPDLAPQQQTATGPIMFKELVGVAMPIPLALTIGRELACVTAGKRVAVRSSFVAKLEAEQHQATLANYLTGVTYSIAAMPVPARLDFLVAVCDFIQRVRDATGFESILSSLMESCWAFCSDDLARYAESTWLQYVPKGSLAAKDGMYVFNANTLRVELFDPSEIKEYRLERAIRIARNGSAIGRDGMPGAGRSRGREGLDAYGLGGIGRPDAGSRDPRDGGRGNVGNSSGPGGRSSGREGLDSYGLGDIGRAGSGARDPRDGGSGNVGNSSGPGGRSSGREGLESYGLGDIGRAGEEWRGRGQGDGFGPGSEAYSPGSQFQPGGSYGIPGGQLAGPFSRGGSPAEQQSDRKGDYITIAMGVVALGIAAATSEAVVLGTVVVGMGFGLAFYVANDTPAPAPEPAPAPDPAPAPAPGDDESSGGGIPVIEVGGKPDPNDPHGKPDPNNYRPAPEDEGGGGPRSRMVAGFPSSSDYYPSPDGGYVGPRGAGVMLVGVPVALGSGLRSSIRTVGPKAFRITP